MTLERSLYFDPRHPALPGHFPGDPLIPGVVILDEVEHTLAAALGPGHVSALPVVKFLSPLRPGEKLNIRAEQLRSGQYRFCCVCGERVVAQGQLAWMPA